jgi:hypothetical protein
LYFQQYTNGNPLSAEVSLQVVARAAIEDFSREDSATRTAALIKDETARRLITSYLLARFGKEWAIGPSGENTVYLRTREWADVLQKAGLGNVPDAGEIAWLAYQAGDFELAEKWAALAGAASVPSNWIRAKLVLRTGNLADAEPLLARVTASVALVEPARSVVFGELGNLRMSLGKYTSALDAFRDSELWEDAAYIAERVLTLDELIAYVDKIRADKCPAPLPSWRTNYITEEDDVPEEERRNFSNELAHLLARRLARAEKYDDALRYFPRKAREQYANYLKDTRYAFDVSNPASPRAAAFFRAARNVRKNGMTLLGTEFGPDYAIWWNGSFERDDISQTRLNPERVHGIGSPTADELERVKKHTVPRARFHYRYHAADLAWWAAALMPNDTDETARVLNQAGGWLKARDPQAANRFFQALVIRCGNTKLGKAAAENHWFVDNSYYKTEPNERGHFPSEFPVFGSEDPKDFNWERYLDEAQNDAEAAFRAQIAADHGYTEAREVKGVGYSNADEMTRYGLAAEVLQRRNVRTVRIYRQLFSSPELLAAFNDWLAVEESALEKLRQLVSGSWSEGSGARSFGAQTRMIQQFSLERDLSHIGILGGFHAEEKRLLNAASPEQNERKIAEVRKDFTHYPAKLPAFEDWLATEKNALVKLRVFAEYAHARYAHVDDVTEASAPERVKALAVAILARELKDQLSRSMDLQH